MSSFREQKTEIKNQDALVKALENMGYKPEVNETKKQVRGHYNENRQAEIILKKEDLKQGGDIGFSLGADGNYGIVTDTYVMKNFDLSKFTKSVKSEYAIAYSKDLARKAGFKLSRTVVQPNGHTQLIYARA